MAWLWIVGRIPLRSFVAVGLAPRYDDNKITEKALVKRANELQAELESAKYDVAGLFASIGRKEKIEMGNQCLVRTFQSQLAQQLKMLHNTVAISVSQQQQQLKQMEEQMQSMVATKNKATEALRNRVESLKTIYGTGIKGLHDHTHALSENSLSTFGKLHSTVSMHAASVQDLLIKSVSEADMVLHDLQNALSEEESKMAANAQQQREGIQRTVESTRVVSKIIVDFFYTLESHASKLSDFVEESQTIHDKNLADIEKSYEECAGNEEKRNLEEIAELLANSTARKAKLVRSAVSSLRESTVDKVRELQQEMLNMQCVASDFQNQWKSFMKQAEEFSVENTESVAAGHRQMEEILQQCMGKTDGVKEQWKNIKDSLQQLEKSNVESVDTTVKTGIQSNQLLLSEFTQAASSADAEIEIGNGRVLSSIDSSLKLDCEACENMKFKVVDWANDSEKLRSSHQGKLEQITKLAEKLRQEYIEDQPTCTTPTRQPIPSTASPAEDSGTPRSDEVANTFQDTSSENISKQENIEISAEVKQLPPTWDARNPLTAINCQPLPGRGMAISLLNQPI